PVPPWTTSISATPAARWPRRRKEKTNDSHRPRRLHDRPPSAGSRPPAVVHRLHAAAAAGLPVDLRRAVREGLAHPRVRVGLLHHLPDPRRPRDERPVHRG